MTTITPGPGNQNRDHHAPPPSFGDPAGAPGTLTAVPHADQYRTAPQDAPAHQPGAPRPDRGSPTPLSELAERLGAESPGAGEVTGITHDSRAVRPGDLYAALPGARFHGADFAAQA
ncbi:Mur ligase domain-containing protein, partial [Streptomyces sp. NPDC005877]